MLEAMAKNSNASSRFAEKLNKSDKFNTGWSLFYLFSPNGRNSGEKFVILQNAFLYRSQILNRKLENKSAGIEHS